MTKYRKKTILLLISSVFLFVFCFNTSRNNEDNEKFLTIIKQLRIYLSNLHFNPQQIDDDFSVKVFNNFIETIDGGKRFFTQEDINSFDGYKTELDDSFKNPNLDFFNLSIDVFFKRVEELGVISDRLVDEIEITKEETINVDFKKINFPTNKIEWENNWRKYVKSLVVQELYSLVTSSENKSKTEVDLLKKAKENVKENLKDFVRRIKKRTKKDFFSSYANSYTQVYDPHTTYFSPKDKEDFDVTISGQLEGIGARLEDKKGIATISELIIGGPAWKSKQLEAGDMIMKVAQGKDKEPVDIVGMLLDESVRLIRGKKGTTVSLTIKKKDNSIKQIAIVRDVVEYGETFAKSAVIKDKNGEKYGILYLPEFYFDIKDKGGRYAAKDVENELIKLKKEGIKGLIFDVRNNGGGSLSEAVDIVGYFIKDGPVVQIKDDKGKITILNDSNSNITWDGPMVVLTNEFSASASEILAAALQDYKRAIIVGSKKTFGKGTVQSFRELKDFFEFSENDNGAIKLTTQKFYRVNGGSTQLKGVESDIVIPTDYIYSDISESANENALSWDKIYEAGNYNIKQPLIIENIIKKSEERLKIQKLYGIRNEKALWVKKIADRKEMPISYISYKKYLKETEAKNKYFDSILKFQNNLTFYSNLITQDNKEKEKSLKAKNDEWFKKLNEDFMLNEALNALKDIK
ncbi:MAG: carboxy terminal-processing peptidase [Solirubrobacteraceae bacterium]